MTEIDALAPRVVDGVAEGAPERALEGAAAEREVDDVGAVVGGPADAGRHVSGGARRRAAAVAVAGVREHPDHDELGVGGHAGHPAVVVGGGGRDAGHVGAVAVVVLGRAAAAPGVAVGADAAGRGDDLAGEVLVAEVDAGVDDGDGDPVAAAGGPGLGSADVLEAPLEALGEDRVVGARWPPALRSRSAPRIARIPTRARTEENRADTAAMVPHEGGQR